MNVSTLVETAYQIILSANGEINNLEVQHRLIQRLAPGLTRRLSEPDLRQYAEFLTVCVHEASLSSVRRAARESKRDDDDGPEDRQGLLPGFKHLQTHYSIRGVTKRIETLTNKEIDEKIAEHLAQGEGHREHANELARYRDERDASA